MFDFFTVSFSFLLFSLPKVMPQGKILDFDTQKLVLELIAQGYSTAQISSHLKVAKNSVKNIEKRGCIQQKRKIKNKLGRKKKLTKTFERRISRKIKQNPFISARKLQIELDIPLHVSNLKKNIKSLKFARKKIKKAPFLSQKAKAQRVEFAVKHLRKSHWESVFFADEKKFNLDGPDGYNYYWSHINFKKERFKYLKSATKAGVMIWGCISVFGGCELSIIPTGVKMNSIKYQDLLTESLVPRFTLAKEQLPEYNWQYIQDNAPCHSSKSTKEWLKTKDISVIPFPPNSPDLNVIENIWSMMADEVYSEKKAYPNISELTKAIQRSWKTVTRTSNLEKLVNSMDDRLLEVLSKNGGNTKY